MKKLLGVLILLLPAVCYAQTKSDIFNPSTPLVFFGSDFSHVQFTKSDEFNNKDQILRYFVDINNVMAKYLKSGPYLKQWQNWLKRDSIRTDFAYVTQANAAVDWQKVYSDDIDYKISDEEIALMIKNLSIDQSAYKDHIGLVYIEENYCKTKPLATLSIVFFNVNNLQPLLIERYSTKPFGMGFLNYWGSVDIYAHVTFKKIYKELK
jgi:hypothetical protein